ncbi:MAG TPA: hypothetical protein VD907_01980 [Verrucomicrobiae bacterium]|nr:hypothetical protein [Verrucomicrobiae bacterium]
MTDDQLSAARHFLVFTPVSSPVDAAARLLAGDSRPNDAQTIVRFLKNENSTIETALLLFLVLQHTRAELITGEMLAQVTRLLTRHEVTPGGPYKNTNGQPTLLVNLLTAAALNKLTIIPPSLLRYLKTTTQNHQPDFESTLTRYFVSRMVNGAPFSSIETARLFDFQQKDGGFPAFQHFEDEQLSRIIATSLAILVLTPKDTPSNITKDPFYETVQSSVMAQLQSLPSSSRALAIQAAEKIFTADTNQEILLLPHFFNQSLAHPLNQEAITTLCKANFFSWLAYTTYDAIQDDYTHTKALPIANVALRQALTQFSLFAPTQRSEIERYFILLDAASSWELAHCRAEATDATIAIKALPKFSAGRTQLAHKSFVHILGPRLIAKTAHYSNATLKNLERGLSHYLIARQLQDDVYDWRADIRKGHLSYVVCHLLKKLELTAGTYQLPELLTAMQKEFWQTGAEALATIQLNHLSKARTLLFSGSSLRSPSPLFTLIEQLEANVVQTQQKYRLQKQFLAAYKK